MLKPTSFKIGCILVLAAALFFHSFGRGKPELLEALDNRITDAMFLWRGQEPSTGSVVIVDIDEKSLRGLGQWPWPRNILARLVKTIHTAGAKVIGFDIVFAEADRTSPTRAIATLERALGHPLFDEEMARLLGHPTLNYDLALGDALAKAPVVLGYAFQRLNDGLKVEGEAPFPSLNIRLSPGTLGYSDLNLIDNYRPILNVAEVSQAETEGFFDVLPDPGGTVHKVPLFMAMDDIPYPSLALEMARLGLQIDEATIHASARGKLPQKDLLGISLAERFIPTDGRGQVTVNFRGPAYAFPYVSAVDILQGEKLERLKDRYVLIGTSAAGLFDLRTTPFSHIFPGVEVQATIIDNILAGDLFEHDILTEIGITYTLIIVGGLTLSALLAYFGPLLGGLGGLLFTAAAVWGNYQLFFLRHKLVGVTYPLLTVVAIFMIVTLFNYFFEGREKRFIHSAFGQYVSPQVVNQLVKNPEKLSLSGEQKNLTVFFSDIRGFTGIAEQLDSESLGRFMNEYLSAMSDIIIEQRGMVDKFIGDAIMAIWGAPLADAAHPANAVRAALHTMNRLREMRPGWKARGLPEIDIGIGINTGIMSVGNFGSHQRIDYTVIGDPVNLASRLEESNKVYGTNIIISEFTRNALGDRFFCRYLDAVRVRGKTQPVRIFEPLLEGEPEAELRDEVRRFEQAVRNYQSRDFAAALAEMESLYRDRPLALYAMYLGRVEAFQKTPPPGDWDGVFLLAEK